MATKHTMSTINSIYVCVHARVCKQVSLSQNVTKTGWWWMAAGFSDHNKTLGPLFGDYNRIMAQPIDTG